MPECLYPPNGASGAKPAPLISTIPDLSFLATQDPKLEKRLNPIEAGKRIKNYLTTLTLELQTLARANGKSDVRNLEPEDLAALTVEAAAMARVPLAGTDWIPGKK